MSRMKHGGLQEFELSLRDICGVLTESRGISRYRADAGVISVSHLHRTRLGGLEIFFFPELPKSV